MINGHTRSWPGQPDSLIDQCWTNCPRRIVYTRNLVRSFSDHHLIVVSVAMKEKMQAAHETKARDRTNWDPALYNSEIGKIDWEEMYESTDMNVINDFFETKVLEVLNKMAPMKTFQSRRKNKSWVSQNVKDLMADRNNLWETAKLSGRPEDWSIYKKRRNEVCKELRKDKNKFYEELYNKMEEEKDTKGLYGLTRQLLGTVSDTSPQFYVKDGKQVRKPVEMANLQLSYYRDKIDKIAEKIIPSQRNPHRFLDAALNKWEDKDERPVFEFRDVTLTEVDKMIATLANSSSFGHDELDSLSIKAAATNLRSPIQFIVNSSLRTSNFPMKWKLARIIPRLKSPELDRNDVSSFRPISVLATVSKLVERAAQGQLLKILESTQQLNPSCHAYRSKMSTTTTLTDILDEIYQGIEDNKLISMMTVDQSAAFDCLHRDLLLQKLSKYNIGQRALDWVDDYLKLRTQYVVVGASQSRMVPVNRGVPQGSVIGPLLYAVYVNDITEVVKNRGCQVIVHNTPSRLFSKQCSKCGILSVYADDSTYTVSNARRPGNQTSLNRVLDEMCLYLNDNQLSMNVGKTHSNRNYDPAEEGTDKWRPTTPDC